MSVLVATVGRAEPYSRGKNIRIRASVDAANRAIVILMAYVANLAENYQIEPNVLAYIR